MRLALIRGLGMKVYIWRPKKRSDIDAWVTKKIGNVKIVMTSPNAEQSILL